MQSYLSFYLDFPLHARLIRAIAGAGLPRSRPQAKSAVLISSLERMTAIKLQ